MRYYCSNPNKCERKVVKNKAFRVCLIKNCPFLKINIRFKRRR